MFDLRTPLFLVLLVAIPVLILVQRRARLSTARWRKTATLLLRGAALLCAIFALANLHRIHKEQRLAVVFLVDISESISSTQHEETFKQINAAVEKLKPTDMFGVVGFAKEVVALTEIRQKQDQLFGSTWSAPQEQLAKQGIGRDGTDVLNALKRAIALLPEGYHQRIILFSDGLHNAGGTVLKEYMPLLSANGVEISTIPLATLKDAVRVVQLQMPTHLRKEQSFEVRAVIETDGSIPTLTGTLYRDGILIGEFEWRLASGTHPLPLTTGQFLETGNHRYTLRLNVVDEIPENNQGHAVVTVQDKPHILYIESDLTHAAALETVLAENGFVVEVLPPAEMPTELIEFQRSDILILSDVSVEDFSAEQLQNIENYVRGLGHGLVVIGGEHGYGPGGYTDTALERTLPVEMTPEERKDAVGIVFVLDTSGSMANYVGTRQKIGLAIEGVLAGIRNLDTEDMAGILGFNVAIQTVSNLTANHDALRRTVSRLRPTGGTTKMKEAVERAYDMLEAKDLKRRHIVLLSDGKSDADISAFLGLAAQIADAQMDITTIAIGDANKELLTEFAGKGGGRAVFVENIQQLPTILTEAVRDTRRYIVQEPFQPVIVPTSESITAGLTPLPQLYGYTATAEKTTAQVFVRSHQDEPILAGWNFGLGKSVAWTSDVKPAWAEAWISWHNFGKFWGQVINWVLPSADAGTDFDLNVSIRQGVAEVNIDTQIPSAAIYKVHVVGPNHKGTPIEIQQVTPTRYSGTFQTQESGSYIVTAEREGDRRRSVETLSLSYPAEYAELRSDTASLKMLASGTGGIHGPTPTQIAAPAGVPTERQTSLARVLLGIAALLFVLEMILRRFSVASQYFTTFLTRFRGETTDNPVPAQNPHVSAGERLYGSETSPQPVENSMARLLAAKKRAR